MTQLKHFLITELSIAQDRHFNNPSPFYNGVKVGWKKAKKLNEKHIAFCKHLLNIVSEKVDEE